MDIAKLMEINEQLRQVHEATKVADEEMDRKNKTMRLLESYLDDAQNMMHRAIGEATVSGTLK